MRRIQPKVPTLSDYSDVPTEGPTPVGTVRPVPDVQTVNATLAVEAHPSAVREARSFLRRTLVAAAVADDVIDTILLLASEVVTNAVIHARTTSELRVIRTATVVRVEVADSSVLVPEMRVFDFESASGRGLAIVQAVASRWGVDQLSEAGKLVWFEVAA